MGARDGEHRDSRAGKMPRDVYEVYRHLDYHKAAAYIEVEEANHGRRPWIEKSPRLGLHTKRWVLFFRVVVI